MAETTDEHRAEVLGVIERPPSDDLRKDLLDVEASGLGPTQFGGQRAEESDETTASTCPADRPEVESAATQRSRWASAAMVRYSAEICADEDQCSCSSSMVWYADSLMPECWRTPDKMLLAVTLSERIEDGETLASREVELGTRASEGDLIIARQNERRVHTLRGGWV